MNRLFVLFISLTIFLSVSNITMAYEKEIKSLSSTMAENIAKATKKTIAVVDFTDLQGNVTELGRFLAEEFSVCLAGAGKGFEVIDRTHLKTILKEHKLAITGIIDPTTARKLGQIAGLDALVTGTITPFGDSVRLSVKILDTATAKVISASSGDIAKTKAIEELLVKGIETGDEVIGTGTTMPPERKAVQTIEIDDFVFTLKECKKSEQTVICSFLVTNNAKSERQFGVGGNGKSYVRGSFLYDDLGNEYHASKAQLGVDISESEAFGMLIPQVSVNASLRFDSVSKQAKKVTLVIGSYDRNKNHNFPATFYNILLTR